MEKGEIEKRDKGGGAKVFNAHSEDLSLSKHRALVISLSRNPPSWDKSIIMALGGFLVLILIKNVEIKFII